MLRNVSRRLPGKASFLYGSETFQTTLPTSLRVSRFLSTTSDGPDFAASMASTRRVAVIPTGSSSRDGGSPTSATASAGIGKLERNEKRLSTALSKVARKEEKRCRASLETTAYKKLELLMLRRGFEMWDNPHSASVQMTKKAEVIVPDRKTVSKSNDDDQSKQSSPASPSVTHLDVFVEFEYLAPKDYATYDDGGVDSGSGSIDDDDDEDMMISPENEYFFDVVVRHSNVPDGPYLVFTCLPYPILQPMSVRFIPHDAICEYNAKKKSSSEGGGTTHHIPSSVFVPNNDLIFDESIFNGPSIHDDVSQEGDESGKTNQEKLRDALLLYLKNLGIDDKFGEFVRQRGKIKNSKEKIRSIESICNFIKKK